MIRNQAGQTVGCNLIDLAGAEFAGAVTVRVCGDGGTETTATESGGLATLKGNGLYNYQPSAAETNFAHVDYIFDPGPTGVTDSVHYDTITAAQASAVQSATGPSVRYVLGVIMNALYGLNVYASGEPIKPADSTLCLFWLNLILDEWNLDPQASYAEPFTVFASTGVNPQSIGPSGDWVLPARPPSIQGVSVDVGGVYQQIYVTDDPRWWAAQQSVLTDVTPWGVYYEASEPNGYLYFNNIAAAATNIRLQLRTYFGRVALTDVLVLPPGYESALTLTLMESIAEPLHATVSASLSQRAGKARARIFAGNLRVPTLSTRGLGLPGTYGGRWNYLTGRVE